MPVLVAASTASTVNAPTPNPTITAWRPLIGGCNGIWDRSLLCRSLLLAVQERLVEPVRLLLAAVDDLRIALQRVEVGVPQDLLHQAHVAARHLEQRRRRRVACHVWRLERPGPQLLADELHDVSRAGGCEAPLAVIARGAVEVDEHRQARVIACREVLLHRIACVRGEIHTPLLRTFARDHQTVARTRKARA